MKQVGRQQFGAIRSHIIKGFKKLTPTQQQSVINYLDNITNPRITKPVIPYYVEQDILKNRIHEAYGKITSKPQILIKLAKRSNVQPSKLLQYKNDPTPGKGNVRSKTINGKTYIWRDDKCAICRKPH